MLAAPSGRPHRPGVRTARFCINMYVFPKYVDLAPLDSFGGRNDVFCCSGSTTQGLLNEGHTKGRTVHSGMGNSEQMGLWALGFTLGVECPLCWYLIIKRPLGVNPLSVESHRISIHQAAFEGTCALFIKSLA